MADEIKTNPSLKSQSAWLLLAKVLGFVFAFMLPLILVRFLTVDKVGVYRQAFQVVVDLVAILPLGLSMSVYYYLGRETTRRPAAIVNILIFNFVTGGIACLGLNLYPQFLGKLFQSGELTYLAPLIGIVVWLWIFSVFLEIVAVANQEPKMATIFIVFAQLSKTVLMAGAVIIFGTVEAFLYAAMIQAVLQIAMLFAYLNSRFPRFWAAFDRKFFLEQLFYAAPFGFAGILWTLQNGVHNYFVGYRFSDAEFAIYAYGCFQIPLLHVLIEAVAAVMIPRMSELQAKDDKKEMVRLMAEAAQKLSFFFFPAFAFLLIAAEVFVITLFTEKFAASVPIFRINLILLPLSIILTDPIVRSYEQLGRYLFILRGFVLIGLFVALYFGIQSLGLLGMITIVVVTFAVDRLVETLLVAYKMKMNWRDLTIFSGLLKTATASAFAAFVTYFCFGFISRFAPAITNSIVETLALSINQSLKSSLAGAAILTVSGILFAIIYLFVANYLKVVTDDEKLLIKNQFAKFAKIFKRDSQNNLKNQQAQDNAV